MKRILSAALLALLGSAPALAADVGVSVSIGQPGFYGRIDIGNAYPAPQVVYAQPVVILPSRVAVVQQPIYLHVPPGHAKDWGKHCNRYRACGQPVYFVQDGWYRNEYVPRHMSERDRNEADHDRGHSKGQGKHRGKKHRHGD
jgi:hypothetical protein